MFHKSLTHFPASAMDHGEHTIWHICASYRTRNRLRNKIACSWMRLMRFDNDWTTRS
jgi:hypothetical protein